MSSKPYFSLKSTLKNDSYTRQYYRYSSITLDIEGALVVSSILVTKKKKLLFTIWFYMYHIQNLAHYQFHYYIKLKWIGTTKVKSFVLHDSYVEHWNKTWNNRIIIGILNNMNKWFKTKINFLTSKLEQYKKKKNLYLL